MSWKVVVGRRSESKNRNVGRGTEDRIALKEMTDLDSLGFPGQERWMWVGGLVRPHAQNHSLGAFLA